MRIFFVWLSPGTPTPAHSDGTRSRSLEGNTATKYRRHASWRSGLTSFASQPVHLETVPEDQEESDRDVFYDGAEKDEPLHEEAEHGDSDASSMSDVPDVPDRLDEDQEDEAWEVSATVRKLYNFFIGMPNPLTVSQTRSGRTNASPQQSCALFRPRHNQHQ